MSTDIPNHLVKKVYPSYTIDMQMYGMSGEPLGHIGQSEMSKIPAWKRDALAKPTASVRKGIAWGFESPSEDTDTLVLTARSGKFVDIRFPKDATTPEQASSHSSYWVFSGKVKTTFYDTGSQEHAIDLPFTAHCVFEQDIDSRGAGFVDEGDMFTLPNGDSIEVGTMENPSTGKDQLYKEYWAGAPPLNSSSTRDDSKSSSVAVAISTDDTVGNMIRVGGRIQGITRSPADSKTVLASRWERVEDGSGVASWKCDARSNANLPWEWLADTNRQFGDTIKHSGFDWKITESHQD